MHIEHMLVRTITRSSDVRYRGSEGYTDNGRICFVAGQLPDVLKQIRHLENRFPRWDTDVWSHYYHYVRNSIDLKDLWDTTYGRL